MDSLSKPFNAIKDFVGSLEDLYQDQSKSLKLYAHLIKRTKFIQEHKGAITKHVNIFKDFCIKNRDAIVTQDKNKLISGTISYSDNVYIDLETILSWSDTETQKVIWEHMLNISACTDKDSDALSILKSRELSVPKTGHDHVRGSDITSNLISKLESKVDTENISDNPMEAISEIFNSGFLTDMMSELTQSIESGSFDLSQIQSSVNEMMDKASEETGENEGMEQANVMINGLFSQLSENMSKQESDPDHNVDLSGVISSITSSILSSEMSTPETDETSISSIEAKINKELEEAKKTGKFD
jgi:hypothetical protein